MARLETENLPYGGSIPPLGTIHKENYNEYWRYIYNNQLDIVIYNFSIVSKNLTFI